jgi:hypothetical protein
VQLVVGWATASLLANDGAPNVIAIVTALAITGIVTSPIISIISIITLHSILSLISSVRAKLSGLSAIVILIVPRIPKVSSSNFAWFYLIADNDNTGVGSRNNYWCCGRSLLHNNLLWLWGALANNDRSWDRGWINGTIVFSLLPIPLHLAAIAIIFLNSFLNSFLDFNLSVLTALYSLLHSDFGGRLIPWRPWATVPFSSRARISLDFFFVYDSARTIGIWIMAVFAFNLFFINDTIGLSERIMAALNLFLVYMGTRVPVGFSVSFHFLFINYSSGSIAVTIRVDISLSFNDLAFDERATWLDSGAGTFGDVSLSTLNFKHLAGRPAWICRVSGATIVVNLLDPLSTLYALIAPWVDLIAANGGGFDSLVIRGRVAPFSVDTGLLVNLGHGLELLPNSNSTRQGKRNINDSKVSAPEAAAKGEG